MTLSNEIIKALVIDDELHARENLKMLIQEFCKGIEVIGEASGKNEAKKIIEQVNPDVIFLDIRMPSGAEGFELLDSIPNKTFQVVFVTAFKDYAIKAFRANAIHYILKPVDIDELVKAVDKIKSGKESLGKSPQEYSDYFKRLEKLTAELAQPKSAKISISHAKGIKIIEADTIIRLQAEGNCTLLHFSDGSKFMDSKILKNYEAILDTATFFRVHKSHIINMNYLSDYSNQEGNFAIMNNGDKVSIGRTKVNEFIEKIKSI